MPTLSIITVNLNNAAGLQKTIESVFEQTFTDYEYIVIDGGSTDESKRLIEKHQDKFAYAVSENDAGIYNAMNKGIEKAKGEYLLFLNSGDHLCNTSVLQKVFSCPLTDDIIYGDIIWKVEGNEKKGKYPDVLSFEFFTKNSLPHQSSFIRNDLFAKIGAYNEDYAIISDWAFFMLAIFKYNSSYFHMSFPISICDREGVSCNPVNFDIIASEKVEFIKKYFSAFARDHQRFISTRNELLLLQEEIKMVKNTLGYRVQYKLKKIFNVK